MNEILRFDAPGADEKPKVGGKGANLGRCLQGGLPVPPGFNVTVDAYATFLRDSGLDVRIEEAVAGIDYADVDDLELRTTAIRRLVEETTMPNELAALIKEAYAELGDNVRVAVRSSGTAEDLAEASFAGLHDTYLHIEGPDSVIDAVQRCWASLWTGRAVSYRHDKGLKDIREIQMSVVVQLMVDAEVSGVMFTANPMSTNTDEIVINANWGLGESVVQGIIEPDEFVARWRRAPAVGIEDRFLHPGIQPKLEIKASSIGSKEQAIVRDPETGQGTVTVDVEEDRRGVPTLTDEQVLELAALGRRVQEYYEGLPQDTEWALADGTFYLLQSRPITGVDFDWAADMETFQWAPYDENTLWTGAFAELMTGAKSALYYHWVSDADSVGYYAIGNALGIPELMGPAYTNKGADVNRPAKLQLHRYYRGEVYYNTIFEKIMVERFFPPAFRSPDISQWMSPEQIAEVRDADFNYAEYIRSVARVALIDPEYSPWTQPDLVDDFIADARAGSNFVELLPLLEGMSDEELKAEIVEQWAKITRYTSFSMILWMAYAPQMMMIFQKIVTAWYTGKNDSAFAELCQGVTTRSKTLEENLELYHLAEDVRASTTLTELFRTNQDGDFFARLGESEDGRAFEERYHAFLREHGHRGHEDRCFTYPRRWEDPSIDYRTLSMLLSREDSVSPIEQEERLRNRREEVYEEVLANLLNSNPLVGQAKAAAFKTMYEWVQKFLAIRDDERWAYELSVMCVKVSAKEVGRRLVKRGIIEDPEDYAMFTRDELFELLDGQGSMPLARAKAAARRRDLEKAANREIQLPAYIRDDREAVVGADAESDRDGLHGTGWTSGAVTATARVVNRLSEISRVKPGDILVCTSTDPGWTSVFTIISGIVTETGGVLSHAVCLSREYGLPAVALKGARGLIPDGATVTINGGTGEVLLVEDSAPQDTDALDELSQAELV